METESGAPVEERPLGELVAKLSHDGSLLIQQEIALAKVELGEKARKLKTDVAAMVTGGMVLYTGLLALTAAAVLILAEAMPAWVAALIVGAAVTSVGTLLVLRGKKNLENFDVVPQKTLTSVQRDVDMMKEAVR